jgi:cell wall integrity and stress response component
MRLVAILTIFVAYAPSASTASIAYCSSQNTADTDATFWTYQSNGWCSDHCRGQAAFAIVLTNNCWCSDYIPGEQTDTGDCNDDCPGFPSEKCGNKDKNLYGYIQLGDPSGTQAASQPSATSPSSAPASPISSSTSTQAPDPATVFRTVTASVPVVSSTPPPSSEASTISKTTPSSAPATDAPVETPVTSVRVVTLSGAIHTETVVTQPNTTGAPTLSQNQKKSTPIGAIVGGVLGGLALLGVIVGLVLFFLWKKRKEQREEDATDAQNGVQRNVSTMSKAGLLRGEKQYPQYPPQIATTFQSSKRNSRLDFDNTSISPISASDRRSSRPVIFDQRLNPSAIMILDNGSRGSLASLDDSHDYGRALNVTNPDPFPRDSIDTRRSQNPPT